MNALDTIEKILTTSLVTADLRYCLVTDKKLPVRIDGIAAKPNVESDFVSLDDLLLCTNISSYAGVGISIQASRICAIDVDHCFKQPNDLASADSRAIDILERFKNIAYCEFSFSGTGLRVLFRQPIIDDYSSKYYIKNDRLGIEFYQPTRSYRYVTVTGNAIHDNLIDTIQTDMLNVDEINVTKSFLDTYMQRPIRKLVEVKTDSAETKSFEELLQQTKYLYLTNSHFQDFWFAQAPGSGKDESERDYFLLAFLYENVTQDKELLRQIFETSPYFKSKDSHHIYKWENQDHRYYNYVYNAIRSSR